MEGLDGVIGIGTQSSAGSAPSQAVVDELPPAAQCVQLDQRAGAGGGVVAAQGEMDRHIAAQVQPRVSQ
ncbi:anthranilate synthase component I [Actinomyces sp. Chiba101]|nr:anthranilate synthase component I [Actinomyces sp. Chiba101]GAV93916.1 anthranilate synthase component I [Actinomyces denticolens]